MSLLKDSVCKYKVKEFSLYPNFNTAGLMLEVTNICNHNCIFCNQSKNDRIKRHIDSDLAFRILGEAAELGINKVGLFMSGEPFANRNIVNYVKFAKEQGIKYVYITTNGALADEKVLKEVLDCGLDSIKFSINAGSRETYRVVHGRDDYDKVINNLKFVYNYRNDKSLNCNIYSSFVITKYTINEVELHYKRIINYVDDIVFYKTQNRAGQNIDEQRDLYVDVNNNKVQEYIEKKAPCPLLFSTINVTCEGYLALCCEEVMNLLVLEDLNKISIKEAWYSDKMVTMRQRHINNELFGTQCYNCIYQTNTKVKPLNEELFLLSRKG